MPIAVINRFALLSLFLFSWSLAWSQPKDNAPYSRLGIGELFPQSLVNQAGTGGWGAGFNDIYHLNLLNPASFAFLQATAFDIGVYAKYARLKGGDETANIWSGNLGYLALGFPLRNPVNESLEKRVRPFKWGMGISLVPYTTVGYDIQTTEVLPGVDTTINNFQGTGGTYRLTWSNGWKYKNFALGLNLGYFFGKFNYHREVLFQDLGVAYQTLFDDAISVRGLTWNAGAQYTINFKATGDKSEQVSSGKRLVLGATAHASNPFTTNSSKLYRGFNPIYQDADTVLNTTGEMGRGRLPMEWSAGVMFEDINQWRLGAEYRFGRWSEYENEAKTGENLIDCWRLSGGLEFIPDINSYNKYAKRIRYRAGLFYQTDPRSFRSELKNYGINIGAGLPIILPRQQISFANIALEFGFLGAPEELRETYGRLSVGFTLNDNSWFFKRKFF